jgi:hypothetical protein
MHAAVSPPPDIVLLPEYRSQPQRPLTHSTVRLVHDEAGDPDELRRKVRTCLAAAHSAWQCVGRQYTSRPSAVKRAADAVAKVFIHQADLSECTQHVAREPRSRSFDLGIPRGRTPSGRRALCGQPARERRRSRLKGVRSSRVSRPTVLDVALEPTLA